MPEITQSPEAEVRVRLKAAPKPETTRQLQLEQLPAALGEVNREQVALMSIPVPFLFSEDCHSPRVMPPIHSYVLHPLSSLEAVDDGTCQQQSRENPAFPAPSGDIGELCIFPLSQIWREPAT